jgi:hypothetical protein
MSPGHLIVPLLFAIVAFFYEWTTQLGSGRGFPSAFCSASLTGVATFIFCVALLFFMGHSVTPA